MNLSFPNSSRSFDDHRNQIRFSGYSGMMEIRFLIDLDAIAKALAIRIAGESDGLAAFDRLRKVIQTTAEKVYLRRKGLKTYILTAADFG